MMDKERYVSARESSKGLFNNALVLPVAIAILHTVEEGATFAIGELREELAGRAADNQIREALKRIVSTGAAIRLTSDSRPRSDAWQRQAHPLWRFVTDWAAELGSELEGAEKPRRAPD